MSVACEAKVCERYLRGSASSNKPLEWTGHRQLSVSPRSLCLPLRGSVSNKLREISSTFSQCIPRPQLLMDEEVT
jgi:hypothetical protein